MCVRVLRRLRRADLSDERRFATGPVAHAHLGTAGAAGGSVVYQMNVGYQVQPIAEISRRLITQANPAVQPAQVFQKTLQASPGGPFSSTENLATPVTTRVDSTYTVSFFCGPGSSVFGCTIGYLPPTQGFVPFTGTPRVPETMAASSSGRARRGSVDLGIPGARTAVDATGKIKIRGGDGSTHVIIDRIGYLI